ncbi:MAG TPA: DUF4399 domain-containing protein [Steroidobacteraceae bacterium]|nr:DUF4399 domain-containing protein [Steroidobacteraceae bacterium]
MKKTMLICGVLSSLLLGATLQADTPPAVALSPSPAGAEVYFVGLKDGDTLSNPVVLHFGLKGMGVAPAGIQVENTGHHHLFIDTDLPTDMTKPIPAMADKVIHFGKGQTETTLSLSPGKHTVQLVLGDYTHTPNNPPVISKKITINVK